MPRGRVKWFLKDGRLHCRHCRLPAADRSRGPEHSQCWCEPGEGAGQPESCQEPFVLAVRQHGYASSELTKLFENHIADYGSGVQGMLRALRSANLRYFEVLLATREGERMTDYAERVGITLGAAKMRKQRARAWARQWLAEQGRELNARRDADRAAWKGRHPQTEGEAA